MATEQKKPLPFIANFTAGAIAGISEILTFYPLDVVKTRMQLERGKTSHGLVGSFKSIIAEEGVGRLYRGLAPPLMLEAPKRAVKFASNDFWGKTYMGWAGEKKMNQSLSVLTGCSAGATESFVVVPFELVKIKLQDKNSVYAGPMDVVRRIIKSDGLLGLYAGMEATFWRHVWWNGGYFGSIFQVKAVLPKAETPQGTLLNNFVSGTVGGFIGTALNTPFDVVKSRIQGAEKIPGVTPKYNWTYPALATILREEGPAALYKGFVPKVLRLAPGGGVLLLVVEFTLSLFRKALGPPYV
ncbi:mitochondrial carrier [Fomitiporia mediterranea MF3/22]|uniref:mitochondrial carrier n=1 Tax=Fomitiporia mediterranea (strain MF3/22) TaxID=694068 RepID=UPI00044082E9|nr:mitochondrial carrier [Fomitiporia mediterranea MF3/22]EJD04982.1 mitochondrial carrier [Fomitiporia mediterranea MF3/22]